MKRLVLSILVLSIFIGLNGCSSHSRNYRHSSSSVEDRLQQLEDDADYNDAKDQLNSMGYRL